MKKKNLLIYIYIIFVFAIFAQPQTAKAFSFQDLTQSVTARINRLYLKIVPGNKSSEAVLRQSLMASDTLKTAMAKTTINGDFTGIEEEDAGNFDFTVEGPMKIKDVYQPQTAQQDLSISGSLTAEGETTDINFDFKQNQDRAFIKLNEIPDLGIIDTSQLMNKWLYWDIEVADIDAMAEGEEVEELTPQQRKEIEQITQDFIQSIELSPAEKMNKEGEAVFVIDGTVDKQALADYLLALDKVVAEEEQESLTQEEVQEAVQTIDNANFTVWIRRSDFYLTLFELTADINLETAKGQDSASAMMGTQSLGLGQPQNMTLTVTSDLSAFNQEVSFIVPEDAVDGQEAIMAAMDLGGMFDFESMGEMPDMDQLPSQAQTEGSQEQMPEMQDLQDMPGYDNLPDDVKEQLNF